MHSARRHACLQALLDHVQGRPENVGANLGPEASEKIFPPVRATVPALGIHSLAPELPSPEMVATEVQRIGLCHPPASAVYEYAAESPYRHGADDRYAVPGTS